MISLFFGVQFNTLKYKALQSDNKIQISFLLGAGTDDLQAR